MAYLAKGVTQSEELVKKFDALAHVRIPGVVKWRYTFDTDWSGDPAIFFWVTVSDGASELASFRKIKDAFISRIDRHADLRNEWGLLPYFRFRTVSEQAELKDEVFE